MRDGRDSLKNLIKWKWKWYIMKNKEIKVRERKQPKVREKLGTQITCRHCGATFTKKFNTHYYCSEECRHEVELAQWRIRSQRYRDKKKQQKLEQEQQMEQQQVLDTNTDTTTDTTDTNDRCDS